MPAKKLAGLDQMHAPLEANQLCHENAVFCCAEIRLFQRVVKISDQNSDVCLTAADIVHRQWNGRKQNAGNQNVIHALASFFIGLSGRWKDPFASRFRVYAFSRRVLLHFIPMQDTA